MDLLYQWYIVELRVFYGYILSGVLFLIVVQIFGVDKTKKQKGNDSLTGAQGDFLEKYQSVQVEFCLHTFEILNTLIMFVEYYLMPAVDFEREGTYLWSMLLLTLYGLVTAA